MTIVDALADQHLFGAMSVFRDLATWRAWLVLLRAAYGFPLAEDERACFQRHTGRANYVPPPGGWAGAASMASQATTNRAISGLSVRMTPPEMCARR